MEKLLTLATQAADQAEVYYEDSSSDSIRFNDAKADKAESSLSSGIALRVIKDGKLGKAHTRNLLDAQALVDQALLAAKNGMQVGFDFPLTKEVVALDTYAPGIESIAKDELIAEGKKTIDYIKARTKGQVNLGFGYDSGANRVMNSAGTDLAHKHSSFFAYVQMVFPGTGSGLFEFESDKGRCQLSAAKLDKLIELFKISENVVTPPTGRMPVIFAESSPYALFSRFLAGISPINIYNKVSPLCGRTGEQIVSDKLTLRQLPHDPELVSSVAFDDEGTPTRDLVLIENGIFKSIITDLNYAHKLNLAPTGNGFLSGISGIVSAQPLNLCLDAGDKSLDEMIASIDKGLIVYSLMGAHSGNILNGEYSVGVASGFYIENGRLVGRVKDCMLTGNAYETLSQVQAVENISHKLASTRLPALLIDGVSVAGK